LRENLALAEERLDSVEKNLEIAEKKIEDLEVNSRRGNTDNNDMLTV